MRNLIKGSIFLLAGAASFAVAHAGVDIEERPLVMPTYDIAPADLNVPNVIIKLMPKFTKIFP